MALLAVTAGGAESSAELKLGERLFAETRFAYGTAAVSCRSCHPAAGSAGQDSRHAVPMRTDGNLTTPRNVQELAELRELVPGGWGLLHWDGEFASLEALVKETFLGRNFGWLPDERAQALSHFAGVIRRDDGEGALSYRVLLRGDTSEIPETLRLPTAWRIDPTSASDEAIADVCVRLVVGYLQSPLHGREGEHHGSAYDAFLEVNRLPRARNPTETPHEYARRLHTAIAAMKSPKFIDGPSAPFGELELRGMRIFFRGTLGFDRAAGSGNCAECHVPPAFTDGAFHNTGAAQDAYDAVHGSGEFAKLTVPALAARNADYDRWLPPTAQHPKGSSAMRSASDESPVRPDLGLWNVYGNPDLSAPQSVIERKLNPDGRLTSDDVLSLTLGRFKTSSLRDLGQSAPYLHNGTQQTIEDVIRFYQRLSDLAQAKAMRNPPPEYAIMKLEEADVAPLAAFLRALNDK